MNKVIGILVLSFLIIGCSLDKKSGIWTKEKNIKESKPTQQKIFDTDDVNTKELNQNIKIKLKYKKKLGSRYDNNYSIFDYVGNLEKISKYKFSRIDRFNEFDSEIIFNNNGLIFFDNKGSILNFNDKSVLIWKKNYYTKAERKSKPILFMATENNTLIVADTVSKYYAINLKNGNILWSKNNSSPYNSQIKIYEDKFFVIDSQNTLNCYSIKDGSKIWHLNTEKSFINSSKKLSIVIKNNKIFFNNSLGDITAADINNGHLLWQISTQSAKIYKDVFNLKTSTLVASKDSILFSNNKNQFYSIDQDTGAINWIQKINSNVRPTLINNLIFTVSLEGYLFILDNNTGKIKRISNIFAKLNNKKKNKIEPIGFIVGTQNIFLTTSNGKLIIIDIATGRSKSILKIDNGKISRPFMQNQNMFIAKDNSIIRLN